jgi:hypothetical protein
METQAAAVAPRIYFMAKQGRSYALRADAPAAVLAAYRRPTGQGRDQTPRFLPYGALRRGTGRYAAGGR